MNRYKGIFYRIDKGGSYASVISSFGTTLNSKLFRLVIECPHDVQIISSSIFILRHINYVKVSLPKMFFLKSRKKH